MSYEFSIDIGGTFTDLYLRNSKGEFSSHKVPTTPEDFTKGFVDAIDKAAGTEGISTPNLLKKTERIIHGTTIATNAIIEDKTDNTALVCTEGFRDVLLFREGGKEDPYKWDVDYPDPYIPRSLTYEIQERISAEGEIITELHENQVREQIRKIKGENVDAVAVGLLWSHANPTHERRVGEIIDELAPELNYALSHEVNPIIREYRRLVSTAIDASLIGPVGSYLSRLQNQLNSYNYDGELLIITANGGVMSPNEIRRRPIWSVDSGPTMLPVTAKTVTENELGIESVVALDMGGTSLDMGVVTEGVIPRTREATVRDDLLGIEKVQVKSIGSGGGSIAKVDEGGLIHVGPESSGAEPGPACYDRGGTQPTVTDAAVELGYLNPNYFLGGEMDIKPKLASISLEPIASKLGISKKEAAYSIYSTATQDMVNGIKEFTIERGIDPRNHVLSGGGGAFGLFAVPIARELGMEQIVLPGQAGVVCSIGGLLSDIRRDFSQAKYTNSSSFDFKGVNEVLKNLREKAELFFERANIKDDKQKLKFFTEARYSRQVWEIQVEVPVESFDDQSDLEELVKSFEDTHESIYGFTADDDVEFLLWRVEATGVTDSSVSKPNNTFDNQNAVDENSLREAYFDGTSVKGKAFRAEDLSPNSSIKGPSFIEARNTTIIIPPKSSAEVSSLGNYRISP